MPKERDVSIDVLRGTAILIMLVGSMVPAFKK